MLGPDGGALEIAGTCFCWHLGAAIKDCGGGCRADERQGLQGTTPVWYFVSIQKQDYEYGLLFSEIGKERNRKGICSLFD